MKKVQALFLFFVVIFLGSCNAYRYAYSVEPTVNPVFTKKGESTVNVHATSNKLIPLNNQYAHGINLQTAYAISNHLAATFNYTRKTEKDVNLNVFRGSSNYFDSSSTIYKRNYFELGLGGFWFIDGNKSHQISCFGGYGWGNLFIDDAVLNAGINSTRFFNTTSSKFYIQPAFAFIEKTVSASFNFKASIIKFGTASTNYATQERDYFHLNKINNETAYSFEPSVNMKLSISKNNTMQLSGGGGLSFYVGSQVQRWSFYYLGLSLDPLKLLKL